MMQNRTCTMDRKRDTDSEEEERMKLTIRLLLAAILLLSFCSFAFADSGYDQDRHPVLEEDLPEYSMPPIPEERHSRSVTSDLLFAEV